MPAPKGNKYYLIAENAGRPLTYKPDELRIKFNKYSDWLQKTPLFEIDFRGKDLQQVKLPKMRPMTVEGFCIFAGITSKTFRNYEEREEFLPIITHVRDIIENQQYEGAAAGFLNPNIVARKLGLADNQSVKLQTEQPLFPDV